MVGGLVLFPKEETRTFSDWGVTEGRGKVGKGSIRKTLKKLEMEMDPKVDISGYVPSHPPPFLGKLRVEEKQEMKDHFTLFVCSPSQADFSSPFEVSGSTFFQFNGALLGGSNQQQGDQKRPQHYKVGLRTGRAKFPS